MIGMECRKRRAQKLTPLYNRMYRAISTASQHYTERIVLVMCRTGSCPFMSSGLGLVVLEYQRDHRSLPPAFTHDHDRRHQKHAACPNRIDLIFRRRSRSDTSTISHGLTCACDRQYQKCCSARRERLLHQHKSLDGLHLSATDKSVQQHHSHHNASPRRSPPRHRSCAAFRPGHRATQHSPRNDTRGPTCT